MSNSINIIEKGLTSKCKKFYTSVPILCEFVVRNLHTVIILDTDKSLANNFLCFCNYVNCNKLTLKTNWGNKSPCIKCKQIIVGRQKLTKEKKEKRERRIKWKKWFFLLIITSGLSSPCKLELDVTEISTKFSILKKYFRGRKVDSQKRGRINKPPNRHFLNYENRYCEVDHVSGTTVL